MDKNEQKWTKKSRNRQKQTEMNTNGHNMTKMDRNIRKKKYTEKQKN